MQRPVRLEVFIPIQPGIGTGKSALHVIDFLLRSKLVEGDTNKVLVAAADDAGEQELAFAALHHQVNPLTD
ncbi:hypothetical protein D3C80_2147120 [compost metagenome]